MTDKQDNWSECKACKAQITWVKTSKAKNLPIDGHVLANVFNPGVHIAHWSTCPDASKFRKKSDDGGGPGKRTENVNPKSLNLNFGEPPESAKALWASRPPHKTPEPILKREQKIFALGRKLIRDGVSKEELQAISERIAGVCEAKHLRYTSQQTMDKVIFEFEKLITQYVINNLDKGN